MSVSIDELYNGMVAAAMEKHFAPSSEHIRLLRAAHIKHSILHKGLMTRLDGVMQAMTEGGPSRQIFDSFIQNLNWAGKLNGPDHNIFAMNDDQLAQYAKLDDGLRKRFAALHEASPEEFETFLRGAIDETASKLADKAKGEEAKAAASWASRFVRNEAGEIHNGKVAALAAGGIAVGAGAVALLKHRQAAAKDQVTSAPVATR